MEVDRMSGGRAVSLTALTLRARRRIFVAEREFMSSQGTFACRTRHGRDESGAVLILALIFLLVIGLIVGGLGIVDLKQSEELRELPGGSQRSVRPFQRHAGGHIQHPLHAASELQPDAECQSTFVLLGHVCSVRVDHRERPGQSEQSGGTLVQHGMGPVQCCDPYRDDLGLPHERGAGYQPRPVRGKSRAPDGRGLRRLLVQWSATRSRNDHQQFHQWWTQHSCRHIALSCTGSGYGRHHLDRGRNWVRQRRNDSELRCRRRSGQHRHSWCRHGELTYVAHRDDSADDHGDQLHRVVLRHRDDLVRIQRGGPAVCVHISTGDTHGHESRKRNDRFGWGEHPSASPGQDSWAIKPVTTRRSTSSTPRIPPSSCRRLTSLSTRRRQSRRPRPPSARTPPTTSPQPPFLSVGPAPQTRMPYSPSCRSHLLRPASAPHQPDHNLVTITGIGFVTNATTVQLIPTSGTFATLNATGVSVSSSTTLTATVPTGGHTGQTYYVEVTTTSGGGSCPTQQNGGCAAGGAAPQYTY